MPVTPHRDYRLNRPFMTPIAEIIEEGPLVKTFVVDYNPIPDPIEIRPGQFVMVWVPGIDEIPMSVSHIGWDARITISVAKVGTATEALHRLQVGDMIGIRGPYGNWYTPRPGIAVVVGGGIGMASILPLIRQLHAMTNDPKDSTIEKLICIEGARSEAQLIFAEEIEELFYGQNALHLCTDDGSCGYKGFTTDRLEELLEDEFARITQNGVDLPITVYACGPEKMLRKISDVCDQKGIEVQASLERMMRCGFGLCGLCALEPTGLLVCKDGPIFSNEVLRKVTDFGRTHRDLAGRPYPL